MTKDKWWILSKIHSIDFFGRGRVLMDVVSAFCKHNISNNCVTSNMNNNWCKKQECKKAAGVAIRRRRVRLQSARATTKLGLSTSKRFWSCFTNKPPDGTISSFARLLDKSSIVRMNEYQYINLFWKFYSKEAQVS